MSLTTVLNGKTVEDLQDAPKTVELPAPSLTDAKIEEVLKYLKWQGGCSETAANEQYIGKGDKEICVLADITVDQLEEIKAARLQKLIPVEK